MADPRRTARPAPPPVRPPALHTARTSFPDRSAAGKGRQQRLRLPGKRIIPAHRLAQEDGVKFVPVAASTASRRARRTRRTPYRRARSPRRFLRANAASINAALVCPPPSADPGAAIMGKNSTSPPCASARPPRRTTAPPETQPARSAPQTAVHPTRLPSNMSLLYTVLKAIGAPKDQGRRHAAPLECLGILGQVTRQVTLARDSPRRHLRPPQSARAVDIGVLLTHLGAPGRRRSAQPCCTADRSHAPPAST